MTAPGEDQGRPAPTGSRGWLAVTLAWAGGEYWSKERVTEFEQEMAGAEIGRGGPDAPAGNELNRSR